MRVIRSAHYGTEALYVGRSWERIVEEHPRNWRVLAPKTLASVYLPLTREQLLWLGRAEALVEEALGGAAGLKI